MTLREQMRNQTQNIINEQKMANRENIDNHYTSESFKNLLSLIDAASKNGNFTITVDANIVSVLDVTCLEESGFTYKSEYSRGKLEGYIFW